MVVLAAVTMVEIEHKEDIPNKIGCYNSTAAQQARSTQELCGHLAWGFSLEHRTDTGLQKDTTQAGATSLALPDCPPDGSRRWTDGL